MGPNKRPTTPYPYPQPTNHKPIPKNPNPKKTRQTKIESLSYTEKYLNLIYKALNLSQISHLILSLPKKKTHSLTQSLARKHRKKNHQRELVQVAQSFRAPYNGGGRVCCCRWFGGGGDGGRPEPEFAAGSPQAEA